MTTDKRGALNQILKTPAIPVYYNDDAAESLAVLEACYAGGIRVFEFTNRGAKALDNFKALKEVAQTRYPDLKLGIGTIKDADSASQFIAAGTDFVVSPIMDAEVANMVQQHGLLWIPGCMTPTEIAQAEKAGARMIKLFPGNVLGTAFLKSVKGLFPDVMFMPTGGVEPTKQSISDWFSAGVKAVGLGAKLFEHENSAGDGYSWLSRRCAQMLEWAEEYGRHSR